MKNLVKSFNQFINESMDSSDWYEESLSDCCGAPIIYPDICSDCKEHCEPQEMDDDFEQGVYEAKKKSRKEVMVDAKEKYPNLKPASMKKGLSHMKGKTFKEKVKKNFGWADEPEAAAAAYMRKATGKEPRDI